MTNHEKEYVRQLEEAYCAAIFFLKEKGERECDFILWAEENLSIDVKGFCQILHTTMERMKLAHKIRTELSDEEIKNIADKIQSGCLNLRKRKQS